MLYNNPKLKLRRKELRKKQTLFEAILWARLKNKKCNGYKFLRQYSVGFYILDFYCPKARLAIELDGGQHNEEEDKQYDKERTAYLNGNNIKELRFWNNDISENLEGAVEKILDHLPLG